MEQHHLFGNRSSKTHYYNKRGTEYAKPNLWNNSNNILGTDLSRILYNESVREEILSYIKMQLADGISNINSEVLTFIITQQLSEKMEVGNNIYDSKNNLLFNNGVRIIHIFSWSLHLYNAI